MIVKEAYLTTIDNPYDPHSQFDEWLLFDNDKGYGTCSYLARIAKTSPNLSDDENRIETERAIDEIMSYDLLGIYKKIYIDVDYPNDEYADGNQNLDV